jgi:hypothetical protein
MAPAGDAAMEIVRRRHAVWANELGGRHDAAALGSALTVLCDVRASLEEGVASVPIEEVAS